jgi:hypothetical protein
MVFSWQVGFVDDRMGNVRSCGNDVHAAGRLPKLGSVRRREATLGCDEIAPGIAVLHAIRREARRRN